MSTRKLSLVSRSSLGRIVRTAVHRSLERAEEGDLDVLLAEEMLRAVRREGRSVRGRTMRDVMGELERSNHDLVRHRERAQAELDQLQQESTVQRELLADTHDAMVRVVDEGAEIREGLALVRLGELFADAKDSGMDLDALRAHIGTLVLEVARGERRGVMEGLQAERDRQVDQLERRIAKLNRTLEQSEAALRELAQRKDLDEGLASIYRTVQGLDGAAPFAEQKRALLEDIFRANVELRGMIGDEALLPRAG